MENTNYSSAITSSLTLIEVLRSIEDKKNLSAEQLFEESFSIINLDNSILEAYCRIYRKLKDESALLSDTDLLIAATAIAHDLILESKDAPFFKVKTSWFKTDLRD